MHVTEIEIPVPWGHISVKSWGRENNPVVLMVHGFMDNAGSFDDLVPLLPEDFYYACIDLPGHGLSSHFPATEPLNYESFALTFQFASDYFKQASYIIIGHSFGAYVACMYSQLYPGKVSKLLLIDGTCAYPAVAARYHKSLQYNYDLFFKNLNQDPKHKPSFTYDEAVRRIADSRISGVLTYETAENLARRMVKESGEDRYAFTNDIRLKSLPHPAAEVRYLEELLKIKPLECPFLVIYNKDHIEFFTDGKYLVGCERYPELMESNRIVLDGHHHSHQTEPEKISLLIQKFLLNK